MTDVFPAPRKPVKTVMGMAMEIGLEVGLSGYGSEKENSGGKILQVELCMH